MSSWWQKTPIAMLNKMLRDKACATITAATPANSGIPQEVCSRLCATNKIKMQIGKVEASFPKKVHLCSQFDKTNGA